MQRKPTIQRYNQIMRNFLLIIFPVLFISCNSSSDQGSSAADSLDALNTELKVPELTEQEQKRRREQYFIWDVDANQKTISKNPQLQSQYFNVDSLIIGLNEMYPEIRLEKSYLFQGKLRGRLFRFGKRWGRKKLGICRGDP